jgi:6-phosphogluconolactonase
MSGASHPRFVHFDRREALNQAVASEISRHLDEAIAQRGSAHLVLAGGSTPGPIYELLAKDRPQWKATHLYWGDERCVPPDDPRSNYAHARATLLDRIHVASAHVHRIRGELTADDAAHDYDAVLARWLSTGETGFPVFDCILLGMGDDGHTASLFPEEPTLEETQRWTATTEGAKASPPVPRVTLTLPVLDAARHVLFAVAGPEKMSVVDAIERSPDDARRYPAARVRPAAGAVWYVSAA